MDISGKSGVAGTGASLLFAMPAHEAVSNGYAATLAATPLRRGVNLGGTMTDTLTAPVADAIAEAVKVKENAHNALPTANNAAILADYVKRYTVALNVSDGAMDVLRMHRRRAAYIAREYETDGTTYITRLAQFGVLKTNGEPLTSTNSASRDANAFAVIATIRPSLWDADTLVNAYDKSAFGLWSAVDKVARKGAAAKGKDGAPSILDKIAAASIAAVTGHGATVQEGGTLHYSDAFSDDAWPALRQEFLARLDRAEAAQGARSALRESRKAEDDAAKAEAESLMEQATGEGAAIVRTAEDVSTSQGSQEDSQGVEPGSGEREPLSFEAIAHALEADLSTLTGGGSAPLDKAARDALYAIVRKFTLSK